MVEGKIRRQGAAYHAKKHGRAPRYSRCAICGGPGAAAMQITNGVYALRCPAHRPGGGQTTRAPEWLDGAACPPDGADVTRFRRFAMTYCVRCPVWRDCVGFTWRTEMSEYGKRPTSTYAMWGVFGGLIPRERIKAASREDLVARAERKLFDLAIRVAEDEERADRTP